MRVAAVIQARTESVRLSRKVLRELAGIPMFAHAVRRAAGFPGVAGSDRVVLAIPDGSQDDRLALEGKKYGARVFRGSENDVLSRIIEACESVDADAVYRVTADNPLVDPGVVKETWEGFIQNGEGGSDYCAMGDTPLGTTVELVTLDALRRGQELAVSDRLREHPTLPLYENPDRFNMRLLPSPEKWKRPAWRFTVDAEPDWKLVEIVFEKLGVEATLDEIVPFLDANPEIAGMNAGIEQDGWDSLKKRKDEIGYVPV